MKQIKSVFCENTVIPHSNKTVTHENVVYLKTLGDKQA